MDEELVLKFLQNECSEDELKLLVEWLSASEQNRDDFFKLELAYNSGKIRRYSGSEFIGKERAVFMKRIEGKQTVSRIHLRRRLWNYAVASVILLVLSIGGILTFNRLNELQTIASASNEVREILLPDGTKVWLNKSSVLKYPSKFADNRRKVKLEGEALFDVSHDKEKPFVVETDILEITVLGTRFNLRSRNTSDLSVVTLLEGEVRVKGNDNEGMVVLSPGQRAELDRSKRRLNVKEVPNAAADAAWHDKLIPFKNATFAEIAKTLEQLYDVTIHLDFAINNLTYSGVIRSDDNIEEVLMSLKNTISFSYQIKGTQVFISNER